MTQPYPQYPPQLNAPVATKQRKIPVWTWIVLGSSVLVAGAIVAAALIFSRGDGDGSVEPRGDALGLATETATAPVEDTAEPEPAPEPIATEDFELKIKMLSEECFGDSGCVVEFRVVPTYVGSDSSFEERTVEITYEVTGLKDKQTNTFDLSNGEYDQYEVEGYGDTPSAGTKLKAKITAVAE